MQRKKTVFQLTSCALMAAVLCILGPISIPIGEVPISFTNFAICLAVCLLGMKWGTTSVVVYLLLGLVGMPVFSGYAGGVGKLAGPTGGYLVGFVFLALIGGFFVEKFGRKLGWTILGLVVGNLVDYVFGTAWFVYQMACPLWYALTVCVFPFLIFDGIKLVVAALLGSVVRRQLVRAHLME